MRSLHETLTLALSYHRRGQTKQAESLYRQVLAKRPNHPDALHLLGMISIQEGNNEEAVKLIRKAISNNIKSFQYYSNLAVALQNLGRNEEAVRACNQALALNQNDFSVYNTLGNALCGLGRYDQAIENFNTAISIKPDIGEIYLNLGKVLKNLGRLTEAEDALTKAVSLKADYAEAYNILGNVLYKQEKVEAAIICYQKALRIRPRYVEAHYNYGNLLVKREEYDTAIHHYRRALAEKPDFPEALCKIGCALLKQEKPSEAAEHFQQALAIRPDMADALNGLGNALREQGNPEEALVVYHNALTIKPDFAEAHYNIGNALFDLGRLDDAVESFHRALTIQPDLAEAHFTIGLALLTKGNYAHGWRKYEWRFMKKGESPAPFSYPCWDGSSLKGRTLLVHAEQGIGDEIMFASCLPEIVGEAELCIVECDRRLVPLFSRSFPKARFIARLGKDDPIPSDLPHIDMQVAIGSLPLYLRPDAQSFPRQKAYLSADAGQSEKWRKRFDTLGEGLKVGITWRGGKGLVRRIRSTTLEQWSELLSIPGIHFINLQYGECGQELREIREQLGITIHDWEDADPFTDLDDFAAKISALDLVISVDNSTVHMAGALGIPVWVLLPFVSEWRWLLKSEDTPWYKSIRLFRQTRPGEWKDVFRSVTTVLRDRLDAGVKREYC